MVETVGTGLSGTIVTWVALSISRPLLLRWQVVDLPNHRSSHVSPTVRAGGAAVATGIFVALMAAFVFGFFDPSILLISGVLLLLTILGLTEDLSGLSIKARLVGQFVLAAFLVVGLHRTIGFSHLILLAIGIGVTVFYVNASNFMDGINGISGLHGIVSGIYFILIGNYYDSSSILMLGIAVACCFAAFLPWNSPHARMFLGDSGSYLLGGSVAAMCLLALSSGVAPLASFAPMLIYSADVIQTLTVRYIRRENLIDAHRDHVYQRIQRLFSSHLLSACWTALTTAACCVLAWVSVLAPNLQPACLLSITCVAIIYIASPTLAAQTLKVIG